MPKSLARIASLLWIILAGMAFAETSSSFGAPAESRGGLPVLTNLSQLHSLSVAEARRKYPLRLKAVVTFFDPHGKSLFIHDETAGAWVYKDFTQTNFYAGQLLEIEGVSDAGAGPAVRPHTMRVVGKAERPTPVPVPFSQLESGKADLKCVLAQGTVRTMAYYFGLLQLNLSVGRDTIPLNLPWAADRALPTNLVGAVVEARGVCSMKVVEDERVVGFWFYVQDLNDIRILKEGLADPYAGQSTPVRTLSRYGRRDAPEQIKVSGVVAYWRRSDRIFLRDQTGSVEVRLRQAWSRPDPNGVYLDPPEAQSLQPGDRVEVTGYLLVESFPLLIDAEYRRMGREIPPEPVSLDLAYAERSPSDLVTIEATLLEQVSRPTRGSVDQVYVFRVDDRMFRGLLHDTRRSVMSIPQGSLVRVTGVNRMNSASDASEVELLLRSADDLQVLQGPPSWTYRNALKWGGLAGVVSMGALTWITVLRRRVRLQSEWMNDRIRAEEQIRQLNEELERRITDRTSELRATNEQLKKEIAEREQVAKELRTAQQELHSSLAKERELGELKSDFVNLVSHEFRTPLGVILSSSEILNSYLDTLSTDERAEHLGNIKECTRYMAGLMEDVLVLGKVEAGKMQFRPITLDIPGFCQRIVDEITSACGTSCCINFSGKDLHGSARGDESLLRHIFANLLSNAAKYSEAGAPIDFMAVRDADDVVFTVRDRGIGIPPDDLKRIFTSFFRARNVRNLPGSGLGLVIVKRCVDLHQGTIDINSVETLGTTVTVRLPLFVKTGHTDQLRKL